MTNDRKIDTEDHPSFPPDSRALGNPAGPPDANFQKKQRRLGNSFAVLFALLGLGLLAVLIVGCSGGSPVILLLVLALGGFLCLHYIVWGRLLSRSEARDNDHSLSDK